ncbi:hypothetical protein [Ammoniphilus resinae]|uniref:Alkylhydroperoxidase family enzyme n=1 Tax=Ammoniphilus resinae TaxID=861532 RepID=A0ABS4GTM5_9BACL|nr:hypothetical protein [Ammoniphilus resinae]MBP1933596.1 alkylhydroperoxidase family enzyme [Ammoniphilus resinae]
MLQKVENFETADLPDLHKNVLRLTDKIVANDLTGREEIYTILKRDFSNSEIVELTMAISAFIAFGRVNRFLDLEF